MSSRLPVEVNPFRLVDQRAVLSGGMPLKALSRLQELLDGDDGMIRVTLDFGKTETGLPMIQGRLEADLQLECQRCLAGLVHPLVVAVNVVLVTDDTQAQRLQEAHDVYLVTDDRLFLQDFIEDEVLLKLPFAVMHDVCQPARDYIEALPEDELDADSGERGEGEKTRQNPFLSLKAMKKDLE